MQASTDSPVDMLVKINLACGSTHGSTTSHRPQKHGVDLDDLLDSLRCNPVPGCGSRICCYDDASFESESEGGRAVGDFDGTVGV